MLVVVVIIAAVGGGVGGSMASKKSTQTSEQAAGTSTVTAAGISPGQTTPAPETTPATTNGETSQGVTAAAAPEDTPTTLSTITTSISTPVQDSSITSPASASSTSTSPEELRTFVTSNEKGYHGCPSSDGSYYTGSTGATYRINCEKLWSWGRDDVANPAVDNLQGCIDECDKINASNPGQCKLAVFGKLNTHVGVLNCWLKSSIESEGGGLVFDSTVASGQLAPIRA